MVGSTGVRPWAAAAALDADAHVDAVRLDDGHAARGHVRARGVQLGVAARGRVQAPEAKSVNNQDHVDWKT